MANEYKHSLTPAQIQYFRIGPKISGSAKSRQKLNEALLERQNIDGSDTSVSLNGIPKHTYGNFEKTVNNFGVLINKNFGEQSILHHMQKFGNLPISVNRLMQQQKQKPPKHRQKQQRNQKDLDTRIALKAIYYFQGFKIQMTLKSFIVITPKHSEAVPIGVLKLLVENVSSVNLVHVVESLLKTDGSIDHERLLAKYSHDKNGEEKYIDGEYRFVRNAKQLITLPVLQLQLKELGFHQQLVPMNKDILEIVESDFDNNEAIAKKYLDFKELNYRIEQTKHTKLPIESGGKHQKAHLESYALTPMHPEHTHENNQLEQSEGEEDRYVDDERLNRREENNNKSQKQDNQDNSQQQNDAEIGLFGDDDGIQQQQHSHQGLEDVYEAHQQHNSQQLADKQGESLGEEGLFGE